jgi:hypothetical protein
MLAKVRMVQNSECEESAKTSDNFGTCAHEVRDTRYASYLLAQTKGPEGEAMMFSTSASGLSFHSLTLGLKYSTAQIKAQTR